MSAGDDKGVTPGRAQDLLIDKALVGLDAAEQAELEALGVAASDEGFELAAAALALARVPEEPLPAALADRLVASWQEQQAVAAEGVTPLVPGRPRGRGLGSWRRHEAVRQVGWLAVAACLAATLATWALRHPRTVVVYVDAPPPIPPAPAPAPTPAEERGQLLREAPDVRTLPWAATQDPVARGAGGDVVWSEARQRGFMRFVGVQANDRARWQYQLWIFDGERDARYPVDGGVFDVPASGEVVVPITARLPVAKPTLFAITVEKAGGVVVSSRERIVLTAAPPPPAPPSPARKPG